MGFFFGFKCCCESDLFKSTMMDNNETEPNNDDNEEDNQKENDISKRNKSKEKTSNEPSIKKFHDSVFACPQQNNDYSNYSDINRIYGVQ